MPRDIGPDGSGDDEAEESGAGESNDEADDSAGKSEPEVPTVGRRERALARSGSDGRMGQELKIALGQRGALSCSAADAL
jgi:hypothetical protein